MEEKEVIKGLSKLNEITMKIKNNKMKEIEGYSKNEKIDVFQAIKTRYALIMDLADLIKNLEKTGTEMKEIRKSIEN